MNIRNARTGATRTLERGTQIILLGREPPLLNTCVISGDDDGAVTHDPDDPVGEVGEWLAVEVEPLVWELYEVVSA